MQYIFDQFGSKRGLLKYLYYKFIRLTGAFNRYKKIDWARVKRVVFICEGNICRSAFSDAYAQKLGLKSASCGLNCTSGMPADPRTIHIGNTLGLTLSNHLTSLAKNFDFQQEDLLIVMEPKQLSKIKAIIAPGSHQITLAGFFGGSDNIYIHDPFNSNDVFFNDCLLSLKGIVENISSKFSHESKE